MTLKHGWQGALHWAKLERDSVTLSYQHNKVTGTLWLSLTLPGRHWMLIRVSKWRWIGCEWSVGMRSISVGWLTLRWYKRCKVVSLV